MMLRRISDNMAALRVQFSLQTKSRQLSRLTLGVEHHTQLREAPLIGSGSRISKQLSFLPEARLVLDWFSGVDHIFSNAPLKKSTGRFHLRGDALPSNVGFGSHESVPDGY
jgi:hypothetical protein